MNRFLPPLLLLCLAGAAVVLWQYSSGPDPVAPPPETPSATANVPAPAVAAAPEKEPSTARVPAIDLDRRPAPSQTANADAAQGVRGRVVDERRRAIPGARAVLVESSSNDPVGRFHSMMQNVPTLPAAVDASDDQGGFQLGLKEHSAHDYEVCLLAEGFASESLGALRLHAGEWTELGEVVLGAGTTIRGRVTVAGTDLPAPQAIVWLESGNPFTDLGAAQLEGWQRRRSAEVDGNGRYELRHAPRRGLFRLLAVAPGFGRQIRDEVELHDGPPLEVDFALPRGLSIGGRLETQGRPLGAVHIEVFAKSAEPVFRGAAAPDGRFFVHGLREGPHLLKIAADGYRPIDKDDIAAGTTDLVIELQPRGRAGVVVRGDGGHLLRQYRLAIRRWFQESGQLGAIRELPERVVRLEAGEQAAFVDGLDHGSYVFQVQAEGYAATVSTPLQLDEEHTEATVEMAMTRGGSLVGTVVDGAGLPVAGAVVTTQPTGADDDNPVWQMLASQTADRITRTSATTGSDGGYRLTSLAHAEYQLTIDHPDYCRSRRSGIAVASDGQETVAPIALQRGCAVRGNAVVDGVPTAQVRVVLTPAPTQEDNALPGPPRTLDESAVGRVEAVTNNDGRFELPRRVPPGSYDLRGVYQIGGDPGADALQRLMQMKKSEVRIEVVPGQETVEQDLRIATDH